MPSTQTQKAVLQLSRDEEVKNHLRGDTLKRPVNATIADVAQLAGVSKMTVSRVLNDEQYVRKETRTKVLSAAKSLKFRRNIIAHKLAIKRSYILGLLYDPETKSYIIDVQNGVLERARERGYDLLIHPCDYQSPELVDEVMELVYQVKVDGLILMPPVADCQKLVTKLEKEQVPYVRNAPGVMKASSLQVCSDERQAAYDMTSYLIELGHRDIGFIIGNPDHSGSIERLEGYKAALAQHKIRVRQALIRQGFYTFESGMKCAKALLRLKNSPTAVFASNDEMALGVLRAAKEQGIQVPRELSVAGFDDMPVSNQISPSLTTVRLPIRKEAEIAADLLINQLNRITNSEPITPLSCTIVPRESTAAIK